ncbi:MAG TPA: hypothetical protein VNO35_13195 [Steroidobacteraceae bacterium]|nr:hypothetical protein [Steroidobacteraceae bacterium]
MKLPTAILVGGLIAGALDISYAFIVYGPLSYRRPPWKFCNRLHPGGSEMTWPSARPFH